MLQLRFLRSDTGISNKSDGAGPVLMAALAKSYTKGGSPDSEPWLYPVLTTMHQLHIRCFSGPGRLLSILQLRFGPSQVRRSKRSRQLERSLQEPTNISLQVQDLRAPSEVPLPERKKINEAIRRRMISGQGKTA